MYPKENIVKLICFKVYLFVCNSRLTFTFLAIYYNYFNLLHNYWIKIENNALQHKFVE